MSESPDAVVLKIWRKTEFSEHPAHVTPHRRADIVRGATSRRSTFR